TGRSLADLTRLDTMATVLDASSFLSLYSSSDLLAERQLSAGEGDERSLADLLVDQVEFANVLILNKTDLIPADDLARLRAILHKLNPEARILSTTRGVVPPDAVLNTGLFDMEKAQSSAGWQRELAMEHTPET